MVKGVGLFKKLGVKNMNDLSYEIKMQEHELKSLVNLHKLLVDELSTLDVANNDNDEKLIQWADKHDKLLTEIVNTHIRWSRLQLEMIKDHIGVDVGWLEETLSLAEYEYHNSKNQLYLLNKSGILEDSRQRHSENAGRRFADIQRIVYMIDLCIQSFQAGKAMAILPRGNKMLKNASFDASLGVNF